MSVSAEGHGADDVGDAGPIAGHPASRAAPTQHPVSSREPGEASSSAGRAGLEDMYWSSQRGADERSGEL